MKKKVMFSTMVLILIIILQGKNIKKKVIKTFGKSEDIKLYTQSICPAYYKPYYDAFFIDLYSNNIYTDKYIYEVKINNKEKVQIGDKIVVSAKLYRLGNKFMLEYVDSFHNSN